MRNEALEIIDGTRPLDEDRVRDILLAASQAYEDGETFLDDDEFDALERLIGGPIQIGSDVRGGKVPLPYPMGSLDQVFEGETIKWVQANGWQDEVFVITDKLDGTSATLIYEGGELTIAFSRGNGTQGADITRHIRKINWVPKTIPYKGHLAVRCEVILSETQFSNIQEDLKSRSGRLYKNARNTVAGMMNSSDAHPAFYSAVDVIATSLTRPVQGKRESIEFLQKQGFAVAFFAEMEGEHLKDAALENYLGERRDLSRYAIDGVVIDLDNAKIRDSINERDISSLNPLWAKKFKVADATNVAQAKVVKVHWAASKLGYLKPRIQIEPVDLVGVTVQYCTGFNAKFIWENHIGPGAVIQITRSGDVIPFCQKVLTPAADGDMPSEDDFGDMVWTESKVDLVMLQDNDESRINRLIAIFQDLDVPNLRGGSVKTLYEAGFTTAAQIIKLDERTLVQHIGENGRKIYEGLRAKMNGVHLGTLAGASQCFPRGIGRRKMRKLVEELAVSEPSELNKLKPAQIAFLDGFDTKTANKIFAGVPTFLLFLADIEGYYTIASKAAPTSNELEGVSVCFTGVRSKELESAIEAKGGKIASSVSSKLSYLVCKDPKAKSGKLDKARTILNDQQIIDLAAAQRIFG